MKVKWLGHAAFLITSEDGVKILTDPFETGAYNAIHYRPILETAEVVTVSHDHADHNYTARVMGSPQILKSPGEYEVDGVPFKGIATHHDTSQGQERGNNIVFAFTVDGMRVCHVGDLGHQLTDAQLKELGEVDVLLVPVGGNFTVDAQGATHLCEKIKPKVVVPMHFKTERCALPIADVEGFLQGKTNAKRLDSSEVVLRKEDLPQETQIIVLKHAL